MCGNSNSARKIDISVPRVLCCKRRDNGELCKLNDWSKTLIYLKCVYLTVSQLFMGNFIASILRNIHNCDI